MGSQNLRGRLSDIAIIGTYPPRLCGIATFTADLSSSLNKAAPWINLHPVAMSDKKYDYPDVVRHCIFESNLASYSVVAETLGELKVGVISVQHEYGIFGGDAGSYLLELVRAAEAPVVTTLHTVLRKPSKAQRKVMQELLHLSARVVVMSQTAKDLLAENYNLDLSKVDFVPHGIPDIWDADGKRLREEICPDGPMILTFGLLSPDKGIQYVIQALPKIVKENPGAKYFIVGATHPQVLAGSGEAYREGLVALAKDLGVEENVVFVNRFVSKEELVEFLSATDYYVTPYLNPEQITSGTLAYSMGAGKVVISTPYIYAKELMDDGRGVRVPFRDSEAIADAVLKVQKNPTLAESLGAKAGDYGSRIKWEHVGELYLEVFRKAMAAGSQRKAAPMRASHPALPPIRLSHLKTLSDDTGIYQHANFNCPNRSEGYCVDDNARALIFSLLFEELGACDPPVLLLQSRYLSFLSHAFNPANGRFRNFMSGSREWLEESGSEDSHGRSMWALGVTCHRSKSVGHRELSRSLFLAGTPAAMQMKSPRACAYTLLGAVEALARHPGDRSLNKTVQLLGSYLSKIFSASQTAAWPWPEVRLSYANARLPQALMEAGAALSCPQWVEQGAGLLEWLIQRQITEDGVFSPISVEGAGVETPLLPMFDQQPVEVWATISACLTARRLTLQESWLMQAERAFGWFLGDNVCSVEICDPETGGCRDGLHEGYANENQGAESTLSYLCSLAELKLAVTLSRAPAAAAALI